jgi:hypothetical protein
MEKMDREGATAINGSCESVSQVVSIISVICEEKRAKRIHPCYATHYEVWLRFIGTMEVFEREISEAVGSKIIREHPYISGTLYELSKN